MEVNFRNFLDDGQPERWQEILYDVLAKRYSAKELNDRGVVIDQIDDVSVTAFLRETQMNAIEKDSEDAKFLAEYLVTWAVGQQFLEEHPRARGWNK